MTTQTHVSVSCPGCSQTYRVPSTTAKASAPCKKCGASIDLSAAIRAAAPAATPPIGGPRTGQDSKPDAAAAAVRARSSRAARALGARNKQPLSPVHVLTGVLTLAAVVIAAVVGLS